MYCPCQFVAVRAGDDADAFFAGAGNNAVLADEQMLVHGQLRGYDGFYHACSTLMSRVFRCAAGPLNTPLFTEQSALSRPCATLMQP